MRKREIEMYIGWDDGTWGTEIIELDGRLSDKEAEESAKEILESRNFGRSVAFIGVYNYDVGDEES